MSPLPWPWPKASHDAHRPKMAQLQRPIWAEVGRHAAVCRSLIQPPAICLLLVNPMHLQAFLSSICSILSASLCSSSSQSRGIVSHPSAPP